MNDKQWFETWFDSPYYHTLYDHRNYAEAENFIQNIGLRMGIRQQATITLMNMLEESGNNILLPDDIMKVYNTYYN